MKQANQILIQLIEKIKTTAIPDFKFASSEIRDAYLDFKSLLRGNWLYEDLVTDGCKIGDFTEIKKLILDLHKAGIDYTSYNLNPFFSVLFNRLVKLLIEDK